MNSVVSYLTTHSMSSGKCSARPSIVFSSSFLICNPLASANWKTMIVAVGFRFNCVPQSYSSLPSSTRATSLTRTTEPPGVARTMMFSNWDTCSRRPSVLSWNSIACPSGAGACPIFPAATCWFCSLIACCTSRAVMPRLFSLAGSNQIRIAYLLRPKLVTDAMPGMRDKASVM